MARSTRKSLAGSAVSAARKAMRRTPAAKPKGSRAAPDTVATTKPAPAKAAARKTASTAATTGGSAGAAAKKAASKAAPATTRPAKKTAAKQAAAKKTAAKQSPAKQTAAKQTAAKQAPAKKTAAKPAAAKKTAAKQAPAKQTAAKQAPARKTAAKQAPAKGAGAAARKAGPTKTAARKAGASRKVSALVVKEGESAWTKAEIKEVRGELTEHREKVAATLAAQEEELALLMRDAGDGAGQDQADMGATSFERDHELTVVNNEREKLAQIDRALARIEDGTYGICESCGNPIGKMRVMAFPRATLCLTCKQREERR